MKTFGYIIVALIVSISTPVFSFAQETPTYDPKSLEGQVLALIGGPEGAVDLFRQKQAVYFATLRDQTKKTLGIKIEDGQDVPSEEAPLPFTEAETMSGLSKYTMDNPFQYATLVFATSMASIFSKVLLFYATVVILVLLFLRLFFKAFI